MDNRVGLICDKKLFYKRDYLFAEDNPVYRAVEKVLVSLKLDQKNAYSSNWNPFVKIIKPGNKVVIKPNLVASRDREKKLKGDVLLASSTNPSVLRPLIDYSWKALKGKGKISIVDTPLEGSDFGQTVRDLGLAKMIDFLRKQEGMNIELLDLRHFKIIPLMLLDNFILGNYSFNIGLLIRKKLSGDPRGYTIIDLKKDSFLSQEGWNYNRLRFHRANPGVPINYHSLTRNEYSIAKTVLNADVFINVPKLKTHKKAGVTLSLKNLVGIVNEKYWLPHFRAGSPPLGDEYLCQPKIKDLFFDKISRLPLFLGNSLIFNIVKINNKRPVISGGAWEGNDTLWRTILDINKILFLADKKGRLLKRKQRKHFTLIDGIIAGEGDGPISPIPKRCGLLIAGFNPLLVDLLTVKVMGFNYQKLKQISQAIKLFGVNKKQVKKTLSLSRLNMDFKPPFGWENLKS